MPGAAEEDEVRDIALADVPSAFESIDGQEVDPEFYSGLRVPDGGAFVDDDAAGVFELLDDRARGVSGGFDDADAGGDDGGGVGCVFGRVRDVGVVGERGGWGGTVVVGGDEGGEQGQVYGEGTGGHRAAAGDLGGERGRGGLGEGCELGGEEGG